MRHWWFYILALLVTLLPVEAPRITRANAPYLTIDIDPETGPADTMVTISGYGAPANVAVVVLVAPWDATIRCDEGRDAAPVAELTTDAEGKFSATHPAEQFSREQVGFTYLAKVVAESAEAPQSVSNVECFSFEPAAKSCFGPETKPFGDSWQPKGRVPIFGYPVSKGLTTPGHGLPIQGIEPTHSDWPSEVSRQVKIQFDRSRSSFGSPEALRQPIAEPNRDCGASDTHVYQDDCRYHRPPTRPWAPERRQRWSQAVYIPATMKNARV